MKILPLKFINGDGGYTSDAIEAIEYAQKMGVEIINCSWGSAYYNNALKNAMADSGILFTCPAGNNSMNVDQMQTYPACFDLDNIISVAAIDNRGNLASFSNYGAEIDVAAPGVNIYGITPENNYTTMNGTSFSTALVTGIAALIKSKYPDETYIDIISRIKNNVVTSTNLKDKVSTGGRVDAYAAVKNKKPQPDNNDSFRNDPMHSTNENNVNTIMESNDLLEKIHYGENGINPATGNFSRTFIDMSLDIPGFKLNISRSYNSKSNTIGKFGRGWTFGFDGSVYEDTSTGIKLITVSLPNGSIQTFSGYSDGINFRANDSRSKLEIVNGKYVLTTKDQYVYTFNSVDSTSHYGYLSEMRDKNGNCISIQVDNKGKITKITDLATGRYFDVINSTYTINNETYNFITSIKQMKADGTTIVRSTDYVYTNNNLTSFKDPAGNNYIYAYTTYQDKTNQTNQDYLTQIKDPSLAFESMVYYQTGIHQNKVYTITDRFKNTHTYVYDDINMRTTITDSNNRKIIKEYDQYYNVTKSQDPENNVTRFDYPYEKWTFKANMGFDGFVGGAVTVNGKIYAIGRNGDGTVEEYDPIKNKWVRKADMLVRRYEPAVAAVKGKIYVIGGNASDYPNGAVDTIEEYDPVSNSWTIKGGLWKNGSGVWQSYGNGMPTKRFGMGVAVLDNKIYLIGGSNRDISLKSVEEYDPSAPPGSAWRIMQDLPIARYELSAAAVNGKIYAIGGWSGGVELASTTEFNPNYGLKGNWVDKSNMFYGRRELGVCEINGKIYAIGGYNGAGGGSVVANKVEEYDPIYNIWRTKASMSLNRRSLGVVALNGKAYAMGGGYTDVEEYQPDAANFGGEIAVSIDNLTTTPASEFSPVVFGESHSLSLNSDGEVSVSGYNSEGQLGLGDNQTRTIKQIIGGMKDVKQIAVGSGSTYILMNDGTVKVFGRNIFGQLGIINDKTNKNFPYTLQGVSGVKKLAVGYDHVIALLNNGNVLAWGKNNFGQLGLGSGISDSVPAQITQLSNVQDVYAGMDFSFAKLSNGKVMVWGRNDQNQLGLGATGNKYTPVENASLFNASQISGGLYHCIALMSDGKLKTWGGNAYGQLGFGDLNARSLPTEITSLTGTVNQISAGIYSSFALTKDGKVVAWGYNGNGVLGIGNNVSKTSPTFIPNLTGIKQISAGFYNCAAITNNDIIKVWGYNVGQLGLGNYEDSYSPVTINSNRTEYLRDEKDNIIKVTKPDGGYKLNFYDFKNSIIKQQDESGRLTFYVYDTNGNLLKKVQPLNGTDEYIEGTSDTSKFSITVHEYYASPGEKPIKGLLKYMYDPEFTSSKTTYNYDHNYYLNSVKDNNQYETTYTYDDRGWKTSQTSPKKFKTDYYYDPNGRLIKIVQNDGNGNGTNGTKQITKSSITRITYDKMGRITKEVHPNLYNSAYDNLATNEYTGLTP